VNHVEGFGKVTRTFMHALAFCALAATTTLIGCTTGEGDTCQLDRDCSDGLVCCPAGLPRGTCEKPESDACLGKEPGADLDASLDASLGDDAGESGDDAGESTMDATMSMVDSSTPQDDAGSDNDGG
jgi:hypothetical protein